MSNHQTAKQDLDNLARAQQMQVNARLTALQAAQTLMGTPGYLGVPGEKKNEAGKLEACWVKEPGAVDHVTLLAIAGDIETYILGNLVQEAQDAIEAARVKMNTPRIVRP